MELSLWENDPPGYILGQVEEIPTLSPYLVPKGSSATHQGAMLVFPGGGYNQRAYHEGEPVALWLNQLGISAFVVNYRITPAHHPCPMLDGQRAIRYVRYHASEWQIDPEKIGVLGFSAGGHLAATLGTKFDKGDMSAIDPLERMSSRPNAMVLCYSVISLGKYCHPGSKKCLLGEDPSREIQRFLSPELHVSPEVPPTFLWHTADDGTVPVENSLLFAKALRGKKVPFEMHIFPNGRHGLGLAPDNPEVAVWKDLCASWLQRLGMR